MIFFSLVSPCFLFLFFVCFGMRTILFLLLFLYFRCMHFAFYGLLPCLTIVNVVKCSFIDVSCAPTAVSEIIYLTT